MEKYYAVFSTSGDIRLQSVARSEQDSIDKFLHYLTDEWDYYKSEGYTVSEITIKKVEDGKANDGSDATI